MIARIAVLLLAALPLAAQTTISYVQKFLPLTVGNSWTYKHEVADDRGNSDGTWVSAERTVTTEFTVSVLRSELIDGETYFVISDVPGNVPRVPKHFIGGKKLRWDGNDLVEHDGRSETSLYQFGSRDLANDYSWREYSIPSTHQDTSVQTQRWYTSTNGMAIQVFVFDGYTEFVSDDGWDLDAIYVDSFGFGRSVTFVERFGVMNAAEHVIDDDAIIYTNELHPVRAVFQADQRDATVTVEWDDFNCYLGGENVRYGRTCGWPPTSTSSKSWGTVKQGSIR